MSSAGTTHTVEFTSWKEIAAHFGKGVRTVQPWELQFGLPVRRPDHHPRGIVRASAYELDEWIKTRWVRTLPHQQCSLSEAVKFSRELRSRRPELRHGFLQVCDSLAMLASRGEERRRRVPG